MANNRYTVTLRAAHPLEAQVIDDLRACAARRRQHRVRQLLMQGLDHRSPPADLTQSVARPSERMRIEVHLHPDYQEDARIALALTDMHPDLIGDFLRATLVAGLLGNVDIVLEAASATYAGPSPAMLPSATKEAAPAPAQHPVTAPPVAVPVLARQLSVATDYSGTEISTTQVMSRTEFDREHAAWALRLAECDAARDWNGIDRELWIRNTEPVWDREPPSDLAVALRGLLS